MIVIVDYGMGNLGSIRNMLKKIGAAVIISSDSSTIQSAEKLILPGVGAFDSAINNIHNAKLTNILNKKVLEDEIPILGICLGMQLMTKSSEEGVLPGMGWIDANTIKFQNSNSRHLRVPNIGWNKVNIKRRHHLFEGIDDNSRFYFVHSYYVNCEDSNDVITTTPYGIEFASSFAHKNIMGVQFHPEKSLKYGFKVLQNFANSL
jgi:imidazole glycerol-phosphate synthase subunit HisH